MLLMLCPWTYAHMLRRPYTTSLLSMRRVHQIGTRYSIPSLQTSTAQLELAETHNTQNRIPTISTLRQENLVPSDFLVFAGEQQPSFHTKLSLHRSSARIVRGESTSVSYKSYSVDGSDGAKDGVELDDDGATTASIGSLGTRSPDYAPFPEYSRGFLYLHRPQPESGLPRSASSIRFRCVPSLVNNSYVTSLEPAKESTPHLEPPAFPPPAFTDLKIYEVFKAGYDLILPSGIPWSIPVVLVAGRPSLEYVRMQLLEDKLLSQGELQEYRGAYLSTSPNRENILLHTLEDVFFVRFDRESFTVRTMTAKDEVSEGRNKKTSRTIPGWRKVHIDSKDGLSVFGRVFMDSRSKYGKKLPYTGSALVRFEHVPERRLGRPILSLRVIKIIEPVECVIPDYDGFINMPKEGKLITRGLSDKPEPWTRQLDSFSRASVLRLVPGYRRNEF